MKLKLVAGIAVAVLFIGGQLYLVHKAKPIASDKDRGCSLHPEQVDGVGVIEIQPAVLAEMNKSLQINGQYVVTTASWRHTE